MKRYFSIFVVALLCGVTFLLFGGWHGIASDSDADGNRYRLNDSLYNSLSDFTSTEKMEQYIRNWMARNAIRGASFAVMKDGHLVYCKGFGWADKEQSIPAEVGNIYRIASASKLITAIGIMKMCDEGLLSLNDKVFGPEGILNDPQFSEIKDKRATQITVRQLLNHTAGFSRRLGDPMFRTTDIMRWEDMDHTPSADELIAFQLRQKLRDKPGGAPQYSNVGYLVLSRVIEKVSGVSYEEYIQQHVLRPAGCYDMHIARNYYEERFPQEVRYYGSDPDDEIESYDGSGQMKPRHYGGNNITGLQGAGAWVCSAVELLRLVASVDGKPNVPDILSAQSIAEMKRINRKGDYALGWARYDRKTGSLVRTGTMSGTCAYIESAGNTSYVFITNTSHYRGASFTNSIGRMVRSAMSKVSEWPTDRDLFVAVPRPSQTTPLDEEDIS